MVNAAVVIQNAKWCMPFAKYIPGRVPRRYEIARTLYLLDFLCEDKVFKYAQDKLQNIIIEAGRLKDLNSYARMLMRRSPYSRNRDLQLLKSYYTRRAGLDDGLEELEVENFVQYRGSEVQCFSMPRN